MKTEHHDMTINGIKIRLILDHASAADLVRFCNGSIPEIPKGCNTFRLPIRMPDGTPGLAINQSGFRPVVTDNEREVNGWMCILLPDWKALSDKNALKLTAKIYEELKKP